MRDHRLYLEDILQSIKLIGIYTKDSISIIDFSAKRTIIMLDFCALCDTLTL